MVIKKLLLIFLTFLFLKNSLISSESQISFCNHVLPFVAGVYICSTAANLYNNYTLMNVKKDKKLYYYAYISKDIIKIILIFYITNYIRKIVNFNLSKYIFSKILTIRPYYSTT